MFLGNEGHFGRHLGYLKELTRRAHEGITGTLRTVLCSYFSSYAENISILWANSRLQLMLFGNDGQFRRHLGIPKNSKRFIGDFYYVTPLIYLELCLKLSLL